MATGSTLVNQNLYTFLSAATANGNSPAQNVTYSKGVLKAWGTWDGATVSIYGGTPGSSGTYIQLSDLCLNPVALTQDSELTLENIVQNESIYVNIAGAGGSTSLTVTLQRI